MTSTQRAKAQASVGDNGRTRTFTTGATRDTASDKFDYEGFLSPYALEAFATYMNFNRSLADGSTRDSDNWQRGIPLDVYAKSKFRHDIDLWREHRGLSTKEGAVWALCGILFNVQGYLHEYLKANPGALEAALKHNTRLREIARGTASSGKAETEKPYGFGFQVGETVNLTQSAPGAHPGEVVGFTNTSVEVQWPTWRKGQTAYYEPGMLRHGP